MSIAVYSRLGNLLRARGLGVEDLRRRIAADTGLEVDARALVGLAGDRRVMRPDIKVVGAAAAALRVGLDDLFDVRIIPDADGVGDHDDHGGNGTGAGEWDPLDPERSHRLDKLVALRDERDLDEGESAELHALMGEANRAMIERGIQDIAQTRGEPPDHMRAEIMAEVERLSALWENLQADPARMAEAVREAKERRRAMRAVTDC